MNEFIGSEILKIYRESAAQKDWVVQGIIAVKAVRISRAAMMSLCSMLDVPMPKPPYRNYVICSGFMTVNGDSVMWSLKDNKRISFVSNWLINDKGNKGAL